MGPGLADFLEENEITFFHGVPTVLATLDRTLPGLRTLNLGGEACPQNLVELWGGPHRRILNTYGPTECTASCTWAELRPGSPVTIGRPLPTYSCTLRDDRFRPVPPGEVGELSIGGVGVARGYVGRPDLTAEKFVIDEHGNRVYRTGDLGRLDADGNIVYLGRKDGQVKIRGHRVDLAEVEGILQESPAVVAAVVTKIETADTGGELAAYVILEPDRPGNREAAVSLRERCRTVLPAYMVPDYVEFVDEIPRLSSGKTDRASLPAPVHPRLVAATDGELRTPQTPTEARLLEVWASVLHTTTDQISTDANFFTALGGHSLSAARLVSLLRATGLGGTADLSIPDLYANPTVCDLAGFVDGAAATDTGPLTHEVRRRYSGLRIAGFAAVQALAIFLLVAVGFAPIALIYALQDGIPSLEMLLQLMASLPVSYLFVRWILPVVLARLTTGLRPGEHRLYGHIHLRVWLLQSALRLSPMEHLSGSHLIAPYLRLLGARVGRGCHIGSAHIELPAAVTLGDDVTVGYGSHLRAVEISGGMLSLGRITVADGATIHGNTVLAGPCTVGERAVVNAQSLVRAGTEVPDGQAWGGSPAAPISAPLDPALESMAACAHAPREWPAALRRRMAVGVLVLEMLPLLALAPVVALVWWALLTRGAGLALLLTAASGLLFVVSTCVLILGLRRFALLTTPEGVHHLRTPLGVEKWFGDKLLEASLELTNSLYATLFTPIWLRLLGANVGRGAEVATIANIDPDLLTLKDSTFVADMASVGSATYAHGHVAFRRTVVSRRAFVGNAAFVPSGTHLGEDSLIGVLSKPPVSRVPRDTAWLGSPAIYLPNRERYEGFDDDTTYLPPRRKVVARYVIEFFRVTLPASILGLSTFATLWVLSLVARTGEWWQVLLAAGVLALAGSVAITLFVALLKWIVVGRYRPRVEPLWSGFVRRTEFVTGIFETAAVPALLALLQGTPLLGPALRLFGARIGRRTLLDTTYLTEFDLVEVGDDATVGSDASLQTHLFEDRVMKMGHVVLEEGSSIGSRAVVLYGATVGQDTTIDPLTLVMKGETLPAHTQWAGIPARRRRRSTAAEPATVMVASPASPAEADLDDAIVEVPHVLEPSTVPQAPAARNRVLGIDVARGLAVIGMMVVHLLKPVTAAGDITWHWQLSLGNSSALFATLAGLGIALSTGGRRPRTGRRSQADVVAILLRAAAVGAIGVLLGLLVPASVAAVILPYYAVLFLLAVPFLRLPAGALAVTAVIVAVAMPVLSHVVRQELPVVTAVENQTPEGILADPATAISQLLLTGMYPALPWLAYVLLGLAIGRVLLARTSGMLLALGGVVLATLATASSWLLLDRLGGMDRLAASAQQNMTFTEFSELLVYGAEGTLPTDSPWWLAVRAPHTSTPLDLLFTMGVSMAVIGLCIVISFVIPDRLGPLAVMGSMPLTAYVGHLLMTRYATELQLNGTLVFWAQIVLLLLFARIWRRHFARGPLEQMINIVAKGGRDLVLTVRAPRKAAAAAGHGDVRLRTRREALQR